MRGLHSFDGNRDLTDAGAPNKVEYANNGTVRRFPVALYVHWPVCITGQLAFQKPVQLRKRRWLAVNRDLSEPVYRERGQGRFR